MSRNANFGHILSILMIGGLALAIAQEVTAQGTTSQQATPGGYVARGTRPAKGLAPGLQVTDLGKSGRTYRINLKKGDEIMSGHPQEGVAEDMNGGDQQAQAGQQQRADNQQQEDGGTASSGGPVDLNDIPLDGIPRVQFRPMSAPALPPKP